MTPNNKDRPKGPVPLPAAQLYTRCSTEMLEFETTAELGDLDVAVGHDRALGALDFGVRIRDHGYNLFVLGRSGSERHRIVVEFLAGRAPSTQPPSDWCYLNNFDDERKPIAVRLPAGRGTELRRDMAQLIEELRAAIPAAFDSEQHRSGIADINQEFEERVRAAFERLQEEAKQQDLSLVSTPHGFAIAPMRRGELIPDEEFERLPAEEKKRKTDAMEAMSARLREHIEQLPSWHKERRDRIKALHRELIGLAAGQLIDQLKARYAEFPELAEYFHDLRESVLDNAKDFQPEDESTSRLPGFAPQAALSRYAVNLLVGHANADKPPVVYENNPSVQNLLGRVEHVAQFGALVTNFTMILPGALHKANGGYLILDAERVLVEPLAWSALKRALATRKVNIESLGQLLSLVSTVSLEPQPIPLDLKVILIGERLIYYLLCEYDPEFGELFKVAADFENRIDRSPENVKRYAQLLGNLARREGLLPLTRAAVARTVEHGARLLNDAEKLTARFRDVADVVREANFWARQNAAPAIDTAHVEKAIDAQVHRLDRMRSEIQEEIQRNSILIDTDGAKIAQVNGLSVLAIGNFAFGQPTRITASVRVGDGTIVDIERETELGGPIHSKGVLILSSYLRSKYAEDAPLSISASLVFEQSYGGVEGDSASLAETCALLSAISGLPIIQSFAVTGSVNQHGQVQVIGGVNEKIEGFFDTCRARGLTGTQGVLIPKDNVQHLMLRADVVAAVEAGRFNVYPITTVDEAISLLTGVAAGERDATAKFPAETVNYRVEERLKQLAEVRREFDMTRSPNKPRKKKAGGKNARGARA
jgi:lon-related putative ATP-dependent protease